MQHFETPRTVKTKIIISSKKTEANSQIKNTPEDRPEKAEIHTPRHGALLARRTSLISLALNTKIHDMITTNRTVVHHNICKRKPPHIEPVSPQPKHENPATKHRTKHQQQDDYTIDKPSNTSIRSPQQENHVAQAPSPRNPSRYPNCQITAQTQNSPSTLTPR